MTTAITKNSTIYSRQIAFVAAFILPTAKFLEAPALLAKYAAGDLLLPAFLHFLLQSAILALLLFSLSETQTLSARLRLALGKIFPVVYIVYATYFVFCALLPLLDMEKFVYAAFFDTSPTTFSFGFFFLFSAYFCTRGIKTVGRYADLCLFLFLVPFLALLVMSFIEADFSHLLPLFGNEFGDTMSAFKYTTPHFSDVVLLLPLLMEYRPAHKNDSKKIMYGYWLGAAFTLVFLAVFFGIYSSIAAREHYAFSKIAQYFPALNVIGRLDLLFIYAIFITLTIYTCLPLRHTVSLTASLLGAKKKSLVSLALNTLCFLFALFFNKYYNGFYRVIGGELFWIFWLIADMVPLFLIFLQKRNQKTEKNYA